MYGVDGERELDRADRSTTSTGYDGARPVRVGNARLRPAPARRVGRGARLGLPPHQVARPARRADLADPPRQVEAALEHWREPDRGIWEVRGEPKHFTSSKLMCWVAADRGARLARIREDVELAERGRPRPTRSTPTSAPTASTSAACSPSTTTPTALDASLLLMPLVRFLPPDDPRVRATVLAIADELTVDGLVLRYRVEETDDGLSGEEGTFTICSFWLVSALVEIGEHDRARRPVREAAVVRQPARALRRGDRPAQRPPPRQLPAGVHPPGADQRRHPRDRGGGRARRTDSRKGAGHDGRLRPPPHSLGRCAPAFRRANSSSS